jgi:hypothetical protein
MDGILPSIAPAMRRAGNYFGSAQAYELISAPSAISMIFGVFQVI